jgi:hypothetical protein
VNKKGPASITKGGCGISFRMHSTLMLLHPGGLLWYNGDSDDASLNPALNAAMLLTRYAPLATSSNRTTSYLVGCQSRLL